MKRLTLLTVLTAALATGCAARVGYRGSVSGQAYGPDLVYVAPGVQVIADYDEPIFYTDNFYWRYDGRSWYRSSVYTGGWVYASPPAPILRIERPHAYVHYRPAGWAPQYDRRGPQQPDTRDHRQARPGRGHQR